MSYHEDHFPTAGLPRDVVLISEQVFGVLPRAGEIAVGLGIWPTLFNCSMLTLIK